MYRFSSPGDSPSIGMRIPVPWSDGDLLGSFPFWKGFLLEGIPFGRDSIRLQFCMTVRSSQQRVDDTIGVREPNSKTTAFVDETSTKLG